MTRRHKPSAINISAAAIRKHHVSALAVLARMCPCSNTSFVVRCYPSGKRCRNCSLLLRLSNGPSRGRSCRWHLLLCQETLASCITPDRQNWLALQRGEAPGSAGARGLTALAGGRDQEAT